MKVAVSIPDAVFEAADRLAERRRCSRSSLYAEALQRLLAHEDSEAVTARLDAIYSDESPQLAPELLEAQRRALTDRW
ncbi:MAG: ChpI protein [bacterium]|nr:ChpI protein [bacterium]